MNITGRSLNGAQKVNMTYEEMLRRPFCADVSKCSEQAKYFKPGVNFLVFNEENVTRQVTKNHTYSNIIEIRPWPKVDIEYESEEELYQKLAERYDMENLDKGDLGSILRTLEDAGILDHSEFFLACSPIPVDGSSQMPSYQTDGVKNALEDYKDRYADYVTRYCNNVSPNAAAKIQEAMAVHNKVDAVLHKIQSYRSM